MLKIIYKISKILTILLLALVLTGCWNNVDLNERRFVMGVGVDKTADNKFELSVQVLRTSKLQTSNKENGGKTSAATDTISSQSETMLGAIRNMLTKIDKKLFYGQIQAVIIGEDMARNGISGVLDMLMRDMESDRRAVVIIAKGATAREILNVKGVQEEIPVVEIINTIENTKAFPKMRETQLYELAKIINSKGNNPVIGVVSMPEKTPDISVDRLDFTGAAAFNKDKLVGWLNPEETMGFLFEDDKIESGIINITNPIDKKSKIAIEIIHSKTKKDINFKNGKPVISIEINEEGNISSVSGHGDIVSFKEISIQENETAQAIKSSIEDVISLSQHEYHTDIFGFGDIVHRKNIKYWKKVENNWDEIFAALPVEIKVKSKIRGSGIIKVKVGESIG